MRVCRQRFAAAVLAAVLTACAQTPPAQTPAQPGVTAREDQSPRFIGLIGTKAQHAAPFLGVPETNFYCLRSFIDRQTGETQHQLYVSDSYSGVERHWNAAHDATGHPLRFIEIGSNQITCDGGCSYAEEFAAEIPDSELRANPQGLAVIFTAGPGAEKRITLSPAQITAQLAAVDGRRTPVAPAAFHQ